MAERQEGSMTSPLVKQLVQVAFLLKYIKNLKIFSPHCEVKCMNTASRIKNYLNQERRLQLY